MWIVAGLFSALILVGGLYETGAIRFHPSLTTQLTKRRTHLMILVYLATFSLLGYAIGVGGR